MKAGLCEDRQWKVHTSSNTAWVKGAQETILGPADVTVVGADFGDLLFVAVDTPEGTNVISVDEAFGIFLLALHGRGEGDAADEELLQHAHYDT